jgi:hypothetical protein
MEIIELKTLIDITNTGVRRANQGTQQQLEQYKNWTTLNQCIEITSLMSYDANPEPEEVDIKNLGFGKKYKGKHKVWTWRFYPDRVGAFADEQHQLGMLIASLEQIPVIKNLTETVNIDTPVFELSNADLKNTTLQVISGTD